MPDLKPGEFRATCRRSTWVPLDVLTPVERAEIDRLEAQRAIDRFTVSLFRYDSKLKCEVVALTCSLETTDRDEYLAHMKRIHPKETAARLRDSPDLAFCKRIKAGWPKLRLPNEGKPFKATKSDASMLVTCGCGLVMERGTSSAELYIREHLERCVAQAGAA
ncbi:hypothetical protein ASE01_19995 [Nocardioides sp. Root190]|uniref:hypothetical protein n=1 Tax=Nocardioides sp. Root190 TaxID=1736488 RepID=UPI0006FA6654|nr:hypothetical protein [Nocardioides sp. Root190]KRB73060.1 hypothetical protein ASE01_19995 [Nocardioides sp. Root190]